MKVKGQKITNQNKSMTSVPANQTNKIVSIAFRGEIGLFYGRKGEFFKCYMLGNLQINGGHSLGSDKNLAANLIMNQSEG